MLNEMSNLMLLSLVSLPVPGVTTSIMQYILQFIYFDILMTSEWLTPWLQSFDDDTEADTYPNGLNYYFGYNQIGSVSLLKNLGSTLIFLAIYALANLLYPLASLAGAWSPSIKKKVT